MKKLNLAHSLRICSSTTHLIAGIFAITFALLSCKKDTTLNQADSDITLKTNRTAAVGGNNLNNPQLEFTFTEKPFAATEKERLKTSLVAADFIPVGLRAKLGTPLSVTITELTGSGTLPELIIGTYSRNTVKTYPLQLGVNSITPTNTGEVYIRYASKAPTGKQVKIKFNSGYQAIPFFKLGTTTHQEWVDMLSADTSATTSTVILLGKNVILAVSKEKALLYKDEDQQACLTLIDNYIKYEDDYSGMDGSSDINAPRKLKFLISEVSSGYMDATQYRIRIINTQINRILTYATLTNNPHGLLHELGHHHQLAKMTPSFMGEVVPNIYSYAARRAVNPSFKAISTTSWDRAFSYLAKPNSDKTVESAADRNALYQQLQLAFGSVFYQNLHKYYRNNVVTTANDEDEKKQFMVISCLTSGKNLSAFFRKWDFSADSTAFAALDALGLPAPATDPTTLREQ